jgi:DNA-binding NtrC family response regulator
MNIHRVLVVDDEPLMRDFVGETLVRKGCEVRYASDGLEAVRAVENDSFDLIFTDMKLPKLSGLDVLKRSKSISPETEIVVMTAYGTVENAVDAMKSGACDYLMKPFTPDQVELLIEKTAGTIRLKAENAYLVRQIDEEFGFGEIIGVSVPMKEIFRTIRKVAATRANVLIEGESGTGKELAARAIHYQGDRRNRPFIKLNCAALPPNLIESELFGHEKGAFTGAVSRRPGRFELADGGTIFLDEISEIDISLQSKLLRVLQEREFERVGSHKSIRVDVRVLASTNRNLKKQVQNGAFREDLYYRLNVVPIRLPSLKDRKGDISLLADHFLKKYLHENGKAAKEFTPEALEQMERYPWPGNVRELQNVIERAVVLDRDRTIRPGDLGIFEINGSGDDRKAEKETGASLPLEEIEKRAILTTLEQCGGNRTRTASVLGISVRTLRNKLNGYQADEIPGGKAGNG